MWGINQLLLQTAVFSKCQAFNVSSDIWLLCIFNFSRALVFVWSAFLQKFAYSVFCLLYASVPYHVFQAGFVLCTNLIFLPSSLPSDLVVAKMNKKHKIGYQSGAVWLGFFIPVLTHKLQQKWIKKHKIGRSIKK